MLAGGSLLRQDYTTECYACYPGSWVKSRSHCDVRSGWPCYRVTFRELITNSTGGRESIPGPPDPRTEALPIELARPQYRLNIASGVFSPLQPKNNIIFIQWLCKSDEACKYLSVHLWRYFMALFCFYGSVTCLTVLTHCFIFYK